MKIINEDENEQYNTNNLSLKKSDLNEKANSKQLSNSKQTFVSYRGIEEDIYSFMEEIHKQNSKVKSKFATKMELRKDNRTDPNVENKTKKFNIGLSDNQTVDAENKSKAQKGLLLLLNKLSGGEFVPEIKTYFTKKKEEIKLQKTKDIEEKANEEEKSKILEKRKMSRQKNITNIFRNETFNNIFKEENDEIGLENADKRYKDYNNEKKNLKQLKQQALNLNRVKNFDEDKEFNLFDNLVMYFTKKEAQEITEYKKNEEEQNTKFVARKDIVRKTEKKKKR